VGMMDAAWFEHIVHPRFSPRLSTKKRATDIVVAGVLGVVLFPAVALAALAIKLSSEGPVLYRQRRLGERGRSFEVLKFRTMRADAEPDGVPAWSTAEDERVTPVGRLLRRSHLDEVPQLWNIIKGDMSLVGPRPERPELVRQLEALIPHYQRRHLIKPGMTGWAQLKAGYGGTRLGAAYKLCYDLYYLKHRSLVFDLLIIIETLKTVISQQQFGPDPVADMFLVGRESAVAPAEVGRDPTEAPVWGSEARPVLD
jgi:lipopolysaccharide/colanic/teichoic acid biosynthesis glycosyltransferase